MSTGVIARGDVTCNQRKEAVTMAIVSYSLRCQT